MDQNRKDLAEGIAIVGIGCRYPGAGRGVENYWNHLTNKGCGLQEVPRDRWNWEAYYDVDPDKPRKAITRWGGFLDDVAGFDADFYNISAREADAMDPQQRLLLETAWDALEDAGMPAESVNGANGSVYVGISICDYGTLQWIHAEDGVHLGPGTALAVSANRISHRLNLRGPSLAIDTACSSSMVALNLGCHSLWRGETDLSLVGGVNIMLHPGVSINFSKANMMSNDGVLKAFDSRANGYVRGEGVGVVVIKRLEDALRDEDRIYAVIRGTVLNQDGQTSTITIPNGDAQRDMLRGACSMAGVDPVDFSYVEAHGTGTPVGDPIEANAIGELFGKPRENGEKLLIGSVKPNIGHLESGAGVAGLIKGALCLYHGAVPPNVNYEAPNPNIKFEEYNLQVPQEVMPMTKPEGERYVAVNSFGFGGTNACAVMSDFAPTKLAAPVVVERPEPAPLYDWGQKVFPLSAGTATALPTRAAQLADWMEEGKIDVSKAASYLGSRRSHLDHRALVVGQSNEDVLSTLRAIAADEAPETLISGRASPREDLAFVFAGQGGQFWTMGRELLAKDKLYRRTLDTFDETFKKVAGFSIVKEMLAANEELSRIHETIVTQPAICALQIGLVERWRAWGLEPNAAIGHSVGEIAAAYTAGVLDLETAPEFIYNRAKPVPERKGGIAAVGIPLAEAEELCKTVGEGLVEIGGINSPTIITIAGDMDKVDAILDELRSRDPAPLARKLKMTYAPHTFHMECTRDEFINGVKDIPVKAPNGKCKWLSTVTGEEVTETPTPEYWFNNIRYTVRFQQAVETARDLGFKNFLEVGPHATLGGPIHACLEGQAFVVTSLHRQKPNHETMTEALGQLYIRGYDFDWEGIAGKRDAYMNVPAYPWEEKKFYPKSELLDEALFPTLDGPLIGERQKTQDPNWINTICFNSCKYVEDHNIDNSVLFPAAGYLELAFEAARSLNGDEEAIEIEDVRLNDAMVMTADHRYQLQTAYDPDRSKVEIYSRQYGGDPDWTLRAAMKMRTRPMPTPLFPDWPEAEDDADPTWHGKFYQDLADSNHFYGPAFAGTVCAADAGPGSGKSWQTVALPSVLEGKTDGYIFHPGMLDSAIQVFAGAIDTVDDKSKEKLTLPIGMDKLIVYRPATDKIRVYTVLTQYTEREFKADVFVTDEEKNPVAVIRGFTCRRLPRAKAAQSDELQTKLYQEAWRKVPLTVEDKDLSDQRIVVLAPEGAKAANAIKVAFEKHGGHCDILRAVAREDAKNGARDFVGTDPEDVARLIGAEVVDTPCDEVISLLSFGARVDEPVTSEALIQAQEFGTLAHLYLAQALMGENPEKPRLWIVTEGAAPAVVEQDMLNLAQCPLHGLARTLKSEIADMKIISVDSDPAADDQTTAEQVVSELLVGGEEEEVAYRAGVRFANRIEEVAKDDVPAILKPAVAAEGEEAVLLRMTMNTPGVTDSIKLVELQEPQAGEGEVVIDVKAVGVNFRDIMAANGMLPEEAEECESWDMLGIECSGLVTAVGDGVSNLKVGDRVMAQGKGTLRSKFVAPAQGCLVMHEDMTYEDAATMPTVFMTALHCIKTIGRLQKGEKILIHVAAGGVGLAAIQICQHIGAEIFATAGTDEKRDYLKSLGVPHVLNSRTLDFADQILEITEGEGIDMVLNSLPGPFIDKGLEVLKPFGRFVEIGKRDVYDDRPVGMKALRQNVSFTAVDLARIEEGDERWIRDLMVLFQGEIEAGRARPIRSTVYPISKAVDAFQYMTTGKHIGKVVITLDDPEAEVSVSVDQPITFRADGAYLISGGMTGFGLELAKWMAGQGAKHLYLLSRSGDSKPEGKAALEELKALGTTPHAVVCDVSKLEDVKAAVALAESHGVEVRGVVHAAAVWADAFIPQQNRDDFLKVLGPKIIGGWHLHEATLGRNLDFFLMFSSIAATLGSQGQSNYVAGNYFLDGLAHYRQARGLPALTVCWGAMEGAGFVEQNENLKNYLESVGMFGVTMGEAMASLDHLLRQRAPEVIVARMDWSKLAFGDSKRFKSLAEQAATGSSGGGQILRELRSLEGEARYAALLTYLAEQVAGVLKADPSTIEHDRPLNEFGLDSLTSFELKNRLETNLEANLPANKFLQRPTLEVLADALMENLEAQDAEGGEGAADGTDAADLPAVLAPMQKAWIDPLTSIAADNPYRRGWMVPHGTAIKPRLEMDKFAEALNDLVARHEALRCYFPTVEGERTVAFLEDGQYLREVDCTTMSDAAVDELLFQECRRTLDFETGPLLEVTVYHLSEDEDALVILYDRTITDAWSNAIVMSELLGLYMAKLMGTEADLQKDPTPYRVFANFQNKLMEGEAGEDLRDYWKDQLADLGPALTLPTSAPRKSVVPAEIGFQMSVLPDGLSEDLMKVAKDLGVTLYQLSAAVYKLMLHKLSGSDDIVLNQAVTGRTRAEFEQMVGSTFNYLPVRDRIESPAMPVTQFVKQAATSVRNALIHQDLSSVQIAELIGMDPIATVNPLNQFHFVMMRPEQVKVESIGDLGLEGGPDKIEMGGMEARALKLDKRQFTNDIYTYFLYINGRTSFHMSYNKDIYSDEMLGSFAKYLEVLFGAVAKSPNMAIGELPRLELVKKRDAAE